MNVLFDLGPQRCAARVNELASPLPLRFSRVLSDRRDAGAAT